MNAKNIFKIIIIICCLLCFVFSGYKILKHFIIQPSVCNTENTEIKNDIKTHKKNKDNKIDCVDLNKLKKINKDAVGWLTIKGLKLELPVVKTTNNSKYLHTNIYGNYAAYGTLFLDKDSGDNLSIMYGHHMKNHTMFGDLVKYKNIKFLKNHSKFYYQDKTGLHKYKIICVCNLSTNFKKNNFNYTDIKQNPEDMLSYINNFKKRSYFNIEDFSDFTDTYIVLSTCDYNYDGDRFVVLARKLDKNEINDRYNIKTNKHVLLPSEMQ